MAQVTEIIKKEMAGNGFRPKRIPGIKYDVIVAEIANSLYTTRHEQDIVPLGVLFCKNDISTQDGVQVVEMAADAFRCPTDSSRRKADFHSISGQSRT